ncbi:hypothetical protein DL96DRAFT_1631460 [Flagelloscypha sp. PMI_526]|nr:hypothetical protein DL96DRAFT_1631460 [Flagelloscypha sp. PMI_526]
MLSLISNSPWSLYAIPAAVVLAYVPHVFKSEAIKKAVGKYNNLAPRNQMAFLEEKVKEGKLQKDVVERIKRMDACHSNALETIHIFNLAVLAGNFAGLDPQFMNAAAGYYLLSRIVYIAIYINQSNRVAAASRTLVWTSGIVTSMVILVRAANAVASK